MAVPELELRPFSPEDYDLLTSWFEDQAQLTQWGGPAVRYPLDHVQLEAMLPEASVPRSWMTLRGLQAVGHAQLIALDTQKGSARLGRVVVAPACRGQGLATLMLRLVLQDTFATPEIQRVDLGVYTGNAGAIRTYARLGFTAGAIRAAPVRVGDQSWDLQEMSLARASFFDANAAEDAHAHPPASSPTRA